MVSTTKIVTMRHVCTHVFVFCLNPKLNSFNISLVLALGQFLIVKTFNLWTYYKKEAKKQNHINQTQ